MTDPVNTAVQAAEARASQGATAVAAEATTLWAKAVGLFNRFWPVGAGIGAGYVLGTLHALGRVF